MSKNSMFEGLCGRAVAKAMARSNHDTELEAIEILDPSPDDLVVAVGIGPGVGVQALSARVHTVVGIDLSQAMIDAASRRCREAIDANVVHLYRTDATSIPVPDGCAGGVVAVNSIQLWNPLDLSLAEVARALRPGSQLVTLTHDWAIQRSSQIDAEEWVKRTTGLCASLGLVEAQSGRAAGEGGRSVIFTVRRSEP